MSKMRFFGATFVSFFCSEHIWNTKTHIKLNNLEIKFFFFWKLLFNLKYFLYISYFLINIFFYINYQKF